MDNQSDKKPSVEGLMALVHQYKHDWHHSEEAGEASEKLVRAYAERLAAGAPSPVAEPRPCKVCGGYGLSRAGTCFGCGGSGVTEAPEPDTQKAEQPNSVYLAPAVPSGDLLSALPRWIPVSERLPECGGGRIFIGINSAGFAGAFNRWGVLMGRYVTCYYETAEESIEVMSDLARWMPMPPTEPVVGPSTPVRPTDKTASSSVPSPAGDAQAIEVLAELVRLKSLKERAEAHGPVAELPDGEPYAQQPGWKLHRCADGEQCRADIGGGCARGWCAHFEVEPSEETGKSHYPNTEAEALLDEYERCKPIAWDRARSLVGRVNPSGEKQ